MYDSDIIKIMGFKEDDCVCFAAKNSGGAYNVCLYKVSTMLNELNNQQELNYYISHATHSGAAGFKENVFNEIVEIVIDIDYGIHHKHAPFATLAEAQAEAGKLPTPTLMVGTGGGIQMHYRLKERLNVSDSKVADRFKRTAQRIQTLVGADSCQGIGHVFRLPYTTNYKDGAEPRPVEIIACNPDQEYDFAWLESWASKHAPLKTATRIARKKTQKKKRRRNKGQDRSGEVFKLIERLLRRHPSITDRKLLAMLKQKPCFDHYTEAAMDPETRCLADIRRIRRKLTTDKRPQPKNEVVEIEYTGEMTEQLSKARERFNQIVYLTNNSKVDISLRLIEKLFLDKSQAIINFPCAAGKTTAAMIIASAHANHKNRMWIVTEKISSVVYIAETLRKLGTNALEWHGRDDSKCKVSRQAFKKYKPKTICKACENHCTAYRKYMSKNVWDDESADVLVTTHSHWSAAIAGEKIPSSVKMVFVDESPFLMEYFSFTLADIKTIKSVFAENKELLETLSHDIDYVCDTLKHGDCRRIHPFNCLKEKDDILKCAYKLFADEKLTADAFEKILSFVNFFSSPDSIYGMLEHYKGIKTYTFIQGTVNLRTSIPHIILDGSSLMSDVSWEGFKIYTCKELIQEYPNTHVHALLANPSKQRLADKAFFAELSQKIIKIASGNNPIMLFKNKDLKSYPVLAANVEELSNRLEESGSELIVMNRGEHIGSNKGREAVVNAVCMSLFNPLSYYVLRAALVSGDGIQSSRIWQTLFKTPLMKKNCGFTDERIQETYTRCVVVDLYQTIMRGCIRNYSDAEYNVICVISGTEIISILQEELLGAKFHFDDSWMLDMLIDGKSDAEIVSLMPDGISKSAKFLKVETLKKAVGF